MVEFTFIYKQEKSHKSHRDIILFVSIKSRNRVVWVQDRVLGLFYMFYSIKVYLIFFL